MMKNLTISYLAKGCEKIEFQVANKISLMTEKFVVTFNLVFK